MAYINLEVAVEQKFERVVFGSCVPNNNTGLQILRAQGHGIDETEFATPFEIRYHSALEAKIKFDRGIASIARKL